jgi:phosphate transport system protein
VADQEPDAQLGAQEIDAKMFQLFALVVEALAAATDALLSGDKHVAAVLAARDELVDTVYSDVELVINRSVALGRPDRKDLRFLLAALRVVPELERSHQLAEHIARRAAYGLGSELTPRARGLVDRMGKVGMAMWRTAADSWYDKQGKVAEELAKRDEEMDELQMVLVSEVAASAVSSSVAMELALVARFYERLGDHAVNVAKMVRAFHDGLGRSAGDHGPGAIARGTLTGGYDGGL